MIVALDLETTGVDKEKDKIIEIALVKFNEDNFEIVDKFSTLVNPGISLPEIISNITNIFDEDLKDAPILDEDLKNKIKDFIGDCPILAHNTDFDRNFLIKNGIDVEKNIVLDTFLLSNIIFLYEKSLNLGSLCDSLKISFDNAHRALDDTIGSIKLFEIIVNKFRKLSKTKKELLGFIFSKGETGNFLFYKNLFSFSKENISKEDFLKKILKVVGKYKENKIDKNRQKKYLKIKEIFNSLSNAEFRQNQLDMSIFVEDTLNNSKKTVIEAPTGVGKTFAYLIPSIIFSLKNKKQVVISTNTKALQDQIFYKDLNFLSKNLSNNFSFSKLKGKKNYFSISRFFDNLSLNNKLEDTQVSFFSKICLWLFETEFGELDELNFFPWEYLLKNNMDSDHFLVLFDNNDYKHYEYIYKARKNAKNSDIVIINHSLLIQESISTQPIFGQIKNLIVDEAHNLEDTTTNALVKNFTLQNLKENTQKILKITNKFDFFIENIDIRFEDLFSQISLIFDLLMDYSNKKNIYGNERFEVLIENDFFIENENIGNILNNVEIDFINIFDKLQTSPDNVYNLIKTEISFLEEILNILKITLDKKSSEKYIGVFLNNKKGFSKLYYTVLNPGEFLEKSIWNKLDSVILTSATLKIDDNFSYIINVLNLDNFEFNSFESDFDYSKQALLFIPNNLGSIKYNNDNINNFIFEFLKIVLGNTLILFTSFTNIKNLYLYINFPLKKLGISVLAQGVGGSKHKIANYFKKYSKKSVILGTDSFWEGVDIPGDDLKYLFIHKFPFLVPDDPIFKARGKLYKDSFKNYSIPKAIIKTKQGFGRLIRTKKDKGIIVLLDDRYFSTNWGQTMRLSFPKNINIKLGNSQDFLKIIRKKHKSL